MEKSPLPSAVPDPKRIDPAYSFTMLSASAIPVITGVASFVVPAGVVNDMGAPGAVVSIVIGKGEEKSDIFPAASIAVAVKE